MLSFSIFPSPMLKKTYFRLFDNSIILESINNINTIDVLGLWIMLGIPLQNQNVIKDLPI